MNKQAKIAIVSTFAFVLLLSAVLVYAGPPECNDKRDNDGDGAKDWPADAGCSAKNDNDETNCGDNVCEGGESKQTCSADCGLPQTCGNNIREGTEVCDGAALNGQTCSSQGYLGGTLSCNTACTGYVTSGCYNQLCGNNVHEGTEVCDGSDLAGQSCVSQGFDGGTLSCSVDCTSFVTSSCTAKPIFDFSLSVNPGFANISAGSMFNSTAVVTLISGSSEQVNLTLSDCPPNAYCQVGTSVGYPTYLSQIGILTAAGTPTGTYNIVITGRSSSVEKMAIVTVNVS